MQHKDPNIKNIVLELTAKFQCHTFILYGSRARGDAKDTSDYDIMGITDSGNTVVRDARVWNDTYLDAFIYPESKLSTPDESMLSMRGGIVLIEKNGIGTLFLKRLEELYKAGPKKLPPDEIQVRRVWAKKMLERAKTEDIEGNFRRHWLLTAVIEDYFNILGMWYRGPKESLNWLKANEPDLFRLYENALKPNATLEEIFLLIQNVDKNVNAALETGSDR